MTGGGISRSTMNVPGALGVLLAAAQKGLAIGGESVLEASNAKVPHEDGDLERTGAVSVDGTRAAISYRDVAYKNQAVDQHENLTYKHDDGREAKYLEKALAERMPQVREALAFQLRKATRG